MSVRGLLFAASILASATACNTTSHGSPDAGVILGDGSTPVGDVTYYRDVRPILYDRCVSCHVEGGVGPFALDTYESTQPLATLIRQVTADRIMPPYLADNSGECGTFRDSRWMTDLELEVLAAWDEQGEPMGEPIATTPPIPALGELTGGVVTIETVEYQPDVSRSDDYRCFVVDAPSATDYFVTGYEVHPGNMPIVHHVIVYAPTSDQVADEAAMLDANEAGDGYTCFGGSGVQAFPVVLWAPGAGATNFPRGTGVKLIGGRPLVIQVHYNTLAGSGTDRTTIDLETAATAAEAYMVPLGDYDLSIAPRMSEVSTSATQSLSFLPVSVRVHGVFPHMHTLGRRLRVEHFTADEGDQCLLYVPRWDFDWQLAYWYERPVSVSPSDSMRITCTYDTTSRTEQVTWGEGTQDEMCLTFAYVTL